MRPSVNGCVTTDNRVPALKTEPLADCTLDSGRMLNIALAFGISIFVLVYAAAAYRCGILHLGCNSLSCTALIK